jgi:23S rRNA (guanosine2251-2'-O)-methyltransferase
MDRALLQRVLTLYGRKPVLETLADSTLECHALHLAQSNRDSGIIKELVASAARRNIPIHRHTRTELSRISKNGKQDQGVALDVICPNFKTLGDHLAQIAEQPQARLIALDAIINPQNLGMIIRSAAAGAIDAILLPSKGCAALGPLVIKASAGTLFKAPIVRCAALAEALTDYKNAGAHICTLEGNARDSLFSHRESSFTIYVLGNETEGVSKASSALADHRLAIPMRHGVESLNVAVAASLIAFSPYFDR